MSIDYSKRASDWEASCVGSAMFFKTYGGGVWLIQFRSPSVCPQPVIFTFSGGGLGYGSGVSTTEDLVSTNPQADDTVGFVKLECLNKFSLHDLQGALGRLSVGEIYVLGLGGSVVIISASGELIGKEYFNSQNIWSSGMSSDMLKKTKLSGGLAVSVGLWFSKFTSSLSTGSEGLVNDNDKEPSKPKVMKDPSEYCLRNDLPQDTVNKSINNMIYPRVVPGPSIGPSK